MHVYAVLMFRMKRKERVIYYRLTNGILSREKLDAKGSLVISLLVDCSTLDLT
jgi:hypothetical protein